jgi:hypothetical protein
MDTGTALSPTRYASIHPAAPKKSSGPQPVFLGGTAVGAIAGDESTNKLHSILLQLAKGQDELAAAEAAATPYWATCPPTVVGHRTAATLLRAEADRLATAS